MAKKKEKVREWEREREREREREWKKKKRKNSQWQIELSFAWIINRWLETHVQPYNFTVPVQVWPNYTQLNLKDKCASYPLISFVGSDKREREREKMSGKSKKQKIQTHTHSQNMQPKIFASHQSVNNYWPLSTVGPFVILAMTA